MTKKSTVSVVRYTAPGDSVRTAIDLCRGFADLKATDRVFVKPNIVFWTKTVPIPKWGVITTSRVVHDTVRLLKEHGVENITIGEGTVLYDPHDRETAEHAFHTLGYRELEKRYGVRVINVFEHPFRPVDLGDGVSLRFNEDFLESDFLVNLPVLKTHAQTMVSLGIKNIKGLIDINSRKKCHNDDPVKDLHFMVSKLRAASPRSLTLIDGLFTNERGPAFDGRMRRSDLLIGSTDVLAADKVGATILGYPPNAVPHLVHAARDLGRPIDLSDVEVVGERIEDVAMSLEYSFGYNDAGTLPLPMEKIGIQGLSYPKYDLSLCTYCSLLTGVILGAIAQAWQGQPWDDVEVLTGKTMQPTEGKKTILVGKCLSAAHKHHPRIKEMITVKTCPPSPEAVVEALHQAGVMVNPAIIMNMDRAPAAFLKRYQGKPEFDEGLFRVEVG